MTLRIGTVLLSVLLLASAGCGGRSDQTAENGATTSSDSSAMAGGGEAAAPAADAKTENASDATTDASTHVVRLIDKGCVQFDPMWITVEPGQSVTWKSELKEKVTLHVDAGGFGHKDFVIAPGATVTSGPAGTVKEYKIVSEPAACQGAPLGSRGSGPGVAVSTSAAH